MKRFVMAAFVSTVLTGAGIAAEHLQDPPTQKVGAAHEDTVASRQGGSDTVCWPKSETDQTSVCVPLSVLRATFAGHTADAISPLATEQLDHLRSIDSLRQAETALVRCMTTVAAGQRDQLLASIVAAAPSGTVFDPAVGRYVKVDKKDK